MAALFVALVACSSSEPASSNDPDASIPEGFDASAPEERPLLPEGLTSYLTGSAEDALPTGAQGGLLLAGGGADVEEAMAWAIERAGGGDVVILRTSGADGYNDYLYQEIGGVDSVETLLVTSSAFADSDYVRWVLDHAELIFLAGGDQWSYLDTWRGTELQRALGRAVERDAVLGGTSAGCAILGEVAFSAENDTVYSSEALEDPYNEYMQLEQGFLSLPTLTGLITDTHFAERDRMGRLMGFLARMMEDGLVSAPLGLGVDEGTAVQVEADGSATVVGRGKAHLLRATVPASRCEAGETLSIGEVEHWALEAGQSLQLPAGSGEGSPSSLSVIDGALSPANPY